jgi:hypothetical protein
MAFYLPNTRMSDLEDVMPATGTTSDIFVGFAIAGTSALPFPESYTNKVEQFVVPTGGTITLSETPVAGQVFVYDTTLATAVTTFTVPGATISGLTAGDTVVVTYKYAMSIIQERALYGDVQPGGYAGAYVGQIGLVTRGDVWITEFNASMNWAMAGTTGNSICLAANGQLTLGTPNTGSAGNALSNVIVTGVPSMTIPYLGLRFSAA